MILGATANQAMAARSMLVFMAVSERASLANIMGLAKVMMRASPPMSFRTEGFMIVQGQG